MMLQQARAVHSLLAQSQAGCRGRLQGNAGACNTVPKVPEIFFVRSRASGTWIPPEQPSCVRHLRQNRSSNPPGDMLVMVCKYAVFGCMHVQMPCAALGLRTERHAGLPHHFSHLLQHISRGRSHGQCTDRLSAVHGARRKP